MLSIDSKPGASLSRSIIFFFKQFGACNELFQQILRRFVEKVLRLLIRIVFFDIALVEPRARIGHGVLDALELGK